MGHMCYFCAFLARLLSAVTAVLPHTPGQDEIYFPETPKYRHNMLCGEISKTEKQTMHQSEINDDFL